MPDAINPAGRPSRPAPSQTDQAGKAVPQHIAEVLAIAGILAEYGRYLAGTLEQRAVARGFATIAQFFGTPVVSVIFAHIYRGIMRAVALQRVMAARAARGRDLVILAPRLDAWRRAPQAEPPAASSPPSILTTSAAQAAPAPVAPQSAASPRRNGTPAELTFDNMPTMAQIEAEVRRRPIGRTIVDICRDLGISPILCASPFWNRLFDAITCYRGSLGNVVLEMRRREKQFAKDDWKYPKLDLPELTREGIRRVLGFLIGEPLADPADLAAPAACAAIGATGPP